MSLRTSIPAGVVDAASSSLGTFAIGVYAIRYLSIDQLGIYTICFTAMILAVNLPSRGWFLPTEVQLLELPAVERLQGFRITLPVGWGAASLGAPAAMIAWIPLLGSDPADVVPLMLTMAAVSVLGPVQDHLRRLMHLGQRSWGAAAISIVYLLGVLGGLALGLGLDIPDVWVPFGALAAANLVSSGFGVAFGLVYGTPPSRSRYRLRSLVRTGRLLVLITAIPLAARFVMSAIVLLVANAATLGLAEAARVAANPYLVFMIGIVSVVIPRVMEASRASDRNTAQRMHNISDRLAIGSIVPLALIIGIDWAGNPLSVLLPAAYASTGLVFLSLMALLPQAMSMPRFFDLLAAQRERALLRINVVTACIALGVTFGSAIIGEYAIPLAMLISSVVRLSLLRSASPRR